MRGTGRGRERGRQQKRRKEGQRETGDRGEREFPVVMMGPSCVSLLQKNSWNIREHVIILKKYDNQHLERTRWTEFWNNA